MVSGSCVVVAVAAVVVVVVRRDEILILTPTVRRHDDDYYHHYYLIVCDYYTTCCCFYAFSASLINLTARPSGPPARGLRFGPRNFRIEGFNAFDRQWVQDVFPLGSRLGRCVETCLEGTVLNIFDRRRSVISSGTFGTDWCPPSA